MVEAHQDSHIDNVLSSLRAKAGMVKRYMDGRLNKDDEAADETNEHGRPSRWDIPDAELGDCTANQRLTADEGMKRIRLALQCRDAVSEEEQARAEQEAFTSGRALVALAPPGCGKTYVMDFLIRKAQCMGARVLACAPAGQLASDIRARHPDIEVGTCHGGVSFCTSLCVRSCR